MARTGSWSRDSRLVQNALFCLLGCSIALSCVISIVQFGTLARASELAAATTRSPSALRSREIVLALVVESKTEAASRELFASEMHQATSALAPLPSASRQMSAEPEAVAERVGGDSIHASDPLEPATVGTRDVEGSSDEQSIAKARSVHTLSTLKPSHAASAQVSEAAPPTLNTSRATPTEERTQTREPVQVVNQAPERMATSSDAERQAARTPTAAVGRVLEPTIRVSRASKGVIVCLFDRILPLGISLIRELRCLGNNEPIEVYHCSELSSANVDLLHAVDDNIKVIDVCRQLVESAVLDVKLARSFRSYWIKPLAIHQSELEEIILLDADDVLMRDPAVVRETVGYKASGTLFFYDRVVRRNAFFNRRHKLADGTPRGRFLKHWLKSFDYARFNVTYGPSSRLLESFAFHGKTCHEQDSSMVLVNKRGAEKAMEVLWFLITEERFRQKFSWGDKEAFWLAYEFSHTPYAFSPWGASVVSSTPNEDRRIHPGTLCGSLAQYLPTDDENEPELLYVNGKALIDPVPFSVKKLDKLRASQVFNMLPTHVVPRQVRSAVERPEQGREYLECLTGLGAVPVPPALHARLWRRRVHFLAISMGFLEPLRSCSSGTTTAASSDGDLVSSVER